MNQPAKAQEPSMEEILASIRRIIADDDAVKPAKDPEPAPPPKPIAVVPPPVAAKPPPAPVADVAAMNQDDIDAMLAGLDAPAPPPAAKKPASPPDPVRQPDEDILDLTEAMAARPAPPMAAPPRPTPTPAPAFVTIGEPDVMFADFSAPTPPPPRPAAAEPVRPLERAHSAAPPLESALMGSTTRAAVDASFNALAHTVLSQNPRTLEDLVKEMLRPMLKGWLDDNLPEMVERLVRAEIERVSRMHGG